MNDPVKNDTDLTSEQQPDKQYLFGRNILLFLVGAEVLFGVFNYLYDHTYFSFTVICCLLIALVYGARMVRALFAVLYFSIGIGSLLEALRLYHEPVIGWLTICVFTVQFLYSIGAGALLLFHPSVKKYMFVKRRI